MDSEEGLASTRVTHDYANSDIIGLESGAIQE
jgi:hypothetical protein